MENLVTGDESFRGDRKLPLKSPLARAERRLIDYWVPKFPRWIEGYHLTLATIPWSAGLILAGWLGRRNVQWLWLASGMMFLQWFTDSFDGSLGKHRDTGIPKWGYYMDHLLDFVFMSSAMIGYALLFNGRARFLFLIMAPLYGAFMVNSYLSFAATSEFKITYLGLGPTEARLALILFNTAIVFFGIGFVEKALPAAVGVMLIALCVVVYRTQKYVWRVDMDDKRRRGG